MSQLERFNFTVLTRRDYLTGGAITLMLFVALLVLTDPHFAIQLL